MALKDMSGMHSYTTIDNNSYDISRLHKNIAVDLDFSNAVALSPKNAEYYLSRDIVDYVRIKPADIIPLQGKLSGRAWKLLMKYYKIRGRLSLALGKRK